MKKKKTKKTKIRNKVAAIILSISLSITVLLGSMCGGIIVSMKQNAVDSMEHLNRLALENSTAALREQKVEELEKLVEDKSSLADTSLQLILNQTRLVAMAAEHIFSALPECGIDEKDLTLPEFQAYDFACAAPELLGSYSIHIRAPRALMEEESIEEENGVIVRASLNPESLVDTEKEEEGARYRMLREYYLAEQLQEVLGGIRNFENGDGTYTGIGATYFCLESSGIDFLADTETAAQVEYDARNSKWYQEAKKLKKGEVFWSDPIQDGSGRGIALICAMPVYVGEELIGVAGSGGLIDNIRELVHSTTIGESGYAFLVNLQKDGTLKLVTGAAEDENAAETPGTESSDAENFDTEAAGTEISDAENSDTENSDTENSDTENSDTDKQAAGFPKRREIALYAENLLDTDNRELAAVFTEMAQQKEGVRQIMLDQEAVFIAYSPLHITDWTMVAVIGLQDASISGPTDALEKQISAVTRDAISESNMKIMLTGLFLTAVIAVVLLLTVFFSYRFAARLAKPLMKLTAGARQVSGGNLDWQLAIDTGDEIQELGEAFEHMTASLKEYIQNLSVVTAEKERIGAELHVATQIQASMLPCIFPPFPDKKGFGIHASMQPAKEVGGDFYDFFLTDESHLAVVMADVSGKGVPAALFMVIAKTLIKNYAQMGHEPAEVFTAVNDRLCENNEANMFVTGWMGILDIDTGDFAYTNAGHNPPLLKRADERFHYMNAKPGFVLAGIEGIKYTQESLQMGKGDLLFLYTDGATEAVNPSGRLYGEERLQQMLDRSAGLALPEILLAVKRDIDLFADGEAQFDDITMLILRKE